MSARDIFHDAVEQGAPKGWMEQHFIYDLAVWRHEVRS